MKTTRYSDLFASDWLAVAVPDVGKEAEFRRLCEVYNIVPVQCLGMWEGLAEVAYILPRGDFSLLEGFGMFDEQTAIVLLAPMGGTVRFRSAWVISERHNSGRFIGPYSLHRRAIEPTGHWIGCGAATAQAEKGWTYSPADDCYFVIR